MSSTSDAVEVDRTFGTALRKLKECKRVARLQWYAEGKWMRLAAWVVVNVPADVGAIVPLILVMKTQGHALQPAQLSSEDLLAEDWGEVLGRYSADEHAFDADSKATIATRTQTEMKAGRATFKKQRSRKKKI